MHGECCGVWMCFKGRLMWVQGLTRLGVVELNLVGCLC